MSLDDTTGEQQNSPAAQDVNTDSSTVQEEQRVPLTRLQEVIAQKNQTAQELDAIRNELQSLKTQQAEPAPVAKTLESFDYDEDAFNKHERERELANIRAELKAEIQQDITQQQQQASFNAKLTNYNQKAPEYAAKNEDYGKAENNMIAQGMNFSPQVADIVLRTGNPAVQHALMSDLQNLHNLNQMTDPTDIALAVGRIQTSLQKPVSSAPDPSPSVGNGSTSGSSNPANMSMEDYARMRRSGN
jgi:hypothetical protein